MCIYAVFFIYIVILYYVYHSIQILCILQYLISSLGSISLYLNSTLSSWFLSQLVELITCSATSKLWKDWGEKNGVERRQEGKALKSTVIKNKPNG